MYLNNYPGCVQIDFFIELNRNLPELSYLGPFPISPYKKSYFVIYNKINKKN